MKYEFKVRRSSIHGRGLFSLSRLPARKKIGELEGDLITQREARRRAKTLRCIAIVEFEDGMALDASSARNGFERINHSCTPNTYLRRFMHRVEFYSLRAIEPGEELTCNYGETHHDGKLPCRCGSERCRGKI
ncbi:MAG TPA: SET domain-containing protein [Thermoanaerobaculia bacterium]|nr:SET domain-containing protein [Thermoanaerobaculia bacterium]